MKTIHLTPRQWEVLQHLADGAYIYHDALFHRVRLIFPDPGPLSVVMVQMKTLDALRYANAPLVMLDPNVKDERHYIITQTGRSALEGHTP